MNNEKYRVHELVKFDYSEIGEYIDEYHTDRPLRNDELVEILNNQDIEIKRLKKEIKYLQSELHNATFNIRKNILKEVKLEIEKLER